jgi:hypothetical protein
VSAPEIGSASCIYPGQSSVCGAAPGEVEVPIVRGAQSFESIDPEIYEEYPVILYGAIWDTAATPKAPVAGATITLPENTGEIVYVENVPGAARVDPIAGAATDAGGMFVAYLKEPTLATVTGGGTTKQVMLGGSFALGSAVIIPLR